MMEGTLRTLGCITIGYFQGEYPGSGPEDSHGEGGKCEMSRDGHMQRKSLLEDTKDDHVYLDTHEL